jgi:hypothetical protein
MGLTLSGSLSARFGGVLLNSMASYWLAGSPPPSFLYPRMIVIAREKPNDTVGQQGYSGISKGNEALIVTALAARVQAVKTGPQTRAELPADAMGESLWKILFRAPKGIVQSRDFIADDFGNEYQVVSAYWNPMVTSCIAQIMET